MLILKKNSGLIAADLSKQEALDADPRAVQQKERANVVVYYILERSKKQYYNSLKEQQMFCK